MSEFKFHSHIKSTYSDAVVNLFFLNNDQRKYRDQIVKVVEKFGEPVLLTENDTIYLSIKGRPDSKCIFVSYGPVLVSALIYVREPQDTIQVIHMVINQTFIKGSKFQSHSVIIHTIDHLKKLAARYKVEKINILYSKKPLTLSVK